MSVTTVTAVGVDEKLVATQVALSALVDDLGNYVRDDAKPFKSGNHGYYATKTFRNRKAAVEAGFPTEAIPAGGKVKLSLMVTFVDPENSAE